MDQLLINPEYPHILSTLIFLPLAGGLVTLVLGKRRSTMRAWALAVTLVDLVLALLLLGLFDHGTAEMQFVDRFAWVASLGISYYVGLDGISLWLFLLTAFMCPIAVLASWRFLESRPETDARPYLFFLLAQRHFIGNLDVSGYI